MRYLKVLGLAAVAAAALMAFVGAGTASAETTACKVTEEPCSVGNQVTSIVAHLAPGTTAVLTPSGFFASDVTCTESTMSGEVKTATTPKGPGSLSFVGCSDPVKVINSPEIIAHHDGGHNGTLTAKSFEVEVEQSGLTCIFGTEANEGITLTGSSTTPIVDATATIPSTSGFPCPSSSVWHAKYHVTSPVFITTGK